MMKIQVTQEHINRGKRNNSRRCPIALALIDAGMSGLSVRGGAIWHYGREVIPWDEKMYRFIDDFDAGELVEPFEFEIEEKAR